MGVLTCEKDVWHILYFFMMQKLPRNAAMESLALHYIVCRCTGKPNIFLREVSKYTASEDPTGLVMMLHGCFVSAAQKARAFYTDSACLFSDTEHGASCLQTAALFEFLCQ